MANDTIVHRLFHQAKTRPEAPAYFEKVNGHYRPTSYREYAEEVRRAAKAMIALGFEAGQTVSILGFNRSEWVIFDVAAMAAGGAPAGIYTTCSHSEVRYIVHHAESPLVLVENESQWEKIHKELENLPLLKHVIVMRGAPKIDHPIVMTWEDFLAKGDGIADDRLDQRLHALPPKGLATLIYTSGTTGPPKGVMLSHENLAWTSAMARDINELTSSDVSVSYLPLSHIAEQVFTIHGPITAGSQVYFAESIEKLPDNLKEVQPTVFFGVPRIWEKFHAGITAKASQATGLKKRILSFAQSMGTAYHAAQNRGHEPGAGTKIGYAIANKLVFSKLKPAVGLGRARICVSGAAPIAREVLEFFASIDVVVQEVYGQSEDTGPTSFNRLGKTKYGTVGPVIPGAEVRIAEDGEILVKGPNVFLGYYKEPEATAETLKDGWLYSGDLGKFDDDGFLVITGRKKEIIITAGGKNIAPKNIEAALKNHPLISEAVVIGDRRKYLTTIVTLDMEAAQRFATERGLSGDLHELPAIKAEVQKAVDGVNEELARVETVKKFTILPKPFAIETGELTPTLKVKRKVVYQRYAAEIEAMYAE